MRGETRTIRRVQSHAGESVIGQHDQSGAHPEIRSAPPSLGRILAAVALATGALAAALVAAPDAARAQKTATVILVPGAGGAVASDFLMRNRSALEARGITTVVAQGNVAGAVARAQRPVVVVGMSRGTLAAAAGAARADGLVLVSGPLMPGPAPRSVQAAAGSPAALPPTLIIHNPNDACQSTPASGVGPFQAWARKAQVVWVNSGPGRGNPCGPFAAHGFAGNDGSAVSAIARFILSR